jgi:hypothetical protein
MRTLRLLNLHCNKTDNNDDNNNSKVTEILITVDNDKFHGFGPESVMNESDWKIKSDIKFNEQAVIGFYNGDSIHNLSNNSKNIRNHVVKENEAQQETKNVGFTLNNANYILTYEII